MSQVGQGPYRNDPCVYFLGNEVVAMAVKLKLWLAWLVWRLSQGESRLMAPWTLAQAGAIVGDQ